MQTVIKIMAALAILFSTNMCMAATESPVIYTVDKPAIVVQPKQMTFLIKLKSNPTTGYAWYLQKYDSNIVEPVKRVFEAPDNKKLIGAPGFEVWTFRVKPGGFTVPMQTVIHFVYVRPWEMGNPSSQVDFQVTTQPKEQIAN